MCVATALLALPGRAAAQSAPHPAELKLRMNGTDLVEVWIDGARVWSGTELTKSWTVTSDDFIRAGGKEVSGRITAIPTRPGRVRSNQLFTVEPGATLELTIQSHLEEIERGPRPPRPRMPPTF